MNTDAQKTKVVFYFNKKNNDLFAFFPDTVKGVFGESYSHVGQHSECHILYAQESRKAKKTEYWGLAIELENIGYNLEILN